MSCAEESQSSHVLFFSPVEVEPGRGSEMLLQTWNSQEEGWKAASDNLLLGYQKRSRLTVIGASIPAGLLSLNRGKEVL